MQEKMYATTSLFAMYMRILNDDESVNTWALSYKYRIINVQSLP